MSEQYAEALSPAVHQVITLACVDPSGSAHTVEAELGYVSRDPYAITLTFAVPGNPVVWTFARELLATGLEEPAGDGDVHVWPCLDSSGRSIAIVELCSPDGELLAQARTRDVQTFLLRSYALVPAGHEDSHLDLDRLVHALLGAA